MKTCSFFGHRNTKETPDLRNELIKIVMQLIDENSVQTFLFGSKSSFDDLCLNVVTEIKKERPKIKLVYFRSAYPHINQSYKDYLLKSYDQTLMPSSAENAGKASYTKRNQAMIDKSDFCVFYYNKNYKPPLRKQSRLAIVSYQPKSGTMLAYQYATKKRKTIFNLFK